MGVELKQTAIKLNEPNYQSFLADLQGGILKGHGRVYSAHLFIRFDTGNQPAARSWIREFARDYITSAQVQNEQIAAYKASRQESKGGIFANLFLTAAGDQAFGYSADNMPRDSQPRLNSGMKSRQPAVAQPARSRLRKELDQ